MPGNLSNVDESNRLAIDMWKVFAKRFRAGEVKDWPGASVAFSRGPIPFFNLGFLSSKVENTEDLRRRAGLIVDYARSTGVPWMMFASDDLLPEGRRDSKDSIYGEFGLHPAMTFRGMVTNQLTPGEPPPKELTIRRVADEETRQGISDINCIAYHMPIELGRQTIAELEFWRSEEFAYVGFVNGEPASCAGTWIVDGIAYVALVATLPEHRRKGYAEAVIRYSLEQATAATGVHRTILHATEAGYPIYKRMGYEDVASFTIYIPEE